MGRVVLPSLNQCDRYLAYDYKLCLDVTMKAITNLPAQRDGVRTMDDLFGGTIGWQTIPRTSQLKLFVVFEAPVPPRLTEGPSGEDTQDADSQGPQTWVKEEKVSLPSLGIQVH